MVGSIPASMRAAFIHATGPAESIEIGEVPVPTPGPGEVLVKNTVLAVDHVDTFVRSGAYRTPLPAHGPFIVGRDLVGVVAEIGDGVTGFAPGDRVWCNSLGHDGRQGSFSEYSVVEAERLYPLPEGVEADAAAAVLHVAATAWIGLFREAQLQSGETVFIGGAGGAVGSAFVQLAHAAAARVIATCSPKDFEWCRASGADIVIDYHDDDALAQVRAAAPGGVHVWCDTSGHHDFEATLPVMRQRGRMLLMSALAAAPPLPVGAVYTSDLQLRGFAISNATVDDLAAAAEVINRMLAAGTLRGRIATVLPLDRTADAHRMLESHAVSGKILVRP
ncbi:Quinone oxidoreductase [Microbacterium esteraromaticum]|uniref:Quinone oxidoreductase n=1 Tax=Microbacterium esteraromaticum TaxID=57043 RepID=A0A1R4K101_9MICO|nr:NADPH:quinone reductase [Microbacterium esteraromaticum]SJN37929.1 Quinone oxidoreductase [Microbacterium esteraromaticum]